MSVRTACNRHNMTEKKKELGLYLSTNFPFSYHGITDFIITAVRGVGKTVIGLETGIILKRKYGYENVKIYYFRLTDLSIKAMVADNAAKAIDPLLIQRYDLEITCKNGIVYDHGKPLVEFLPLVSAGSKGKGVNLYDCNYFNRVDEEGNRVKTFVVTIWDEFLMAEGVEKRSIGDPVAQYRIYREAIMRDAQLLDYDAVYNFYLANNVSECASVTGALFNYIPDPNNHRRVKLTRKRAVFWNVPITDAYIAHRKNSYNANIMDYANDPNYAEVKRDMSMIKPKKVRMIRVTTLLKFDKIDKRKWYCLYDNKYIRLYKGEKIAKENIYPMRRHLDELYNINIVNQILEIYDAKAFMYADLISMASFQNDMKLLKPK